MTAPRSRRQTQLFQVTHPFHPLSGQEFELLRTNGKGADAGLFFHDRQGKLSLIPLAWTNLALEDPFVILSAGRCWFRMVDLLELAGLVESLKP